MVGGAEDPGDDGLISGINVTPFVDIALVLLIIFMVTAKYIVSQPQIPVDLPRASTSQNSLIASTVQVSVNREGQFFVDARPVNEAQLRQIMDERHRANPEIRAIIAADRAVSHGRVVQAIDIIRGSGVSRFGIQTEYANPVETGR